MKSVLISIHPKWCEMIASGKKTVEVRKTRPKLTTPFKVYIYCTKDEPMYRSGDKFWCPNDDCGNGKVIGEFVCRNIDEYDPIQAHSGAIYWLDDRSFENTGFENLEDLCKYGNGKRLYGWNISNLVIYDQPKKLSEFYQKCKSYDKDEWENDDCLECENPCGNGGKLYLKRAPQSWCYVERATDERAD